MDRTIGTGTRRVHQSRDNGPHRLHGSPGPFPGRAIRRGARGHDDGTGGSGTDRRCVRGRAGRSIGLGSSRTGLPRVDDCHGPTAATDRSSHARIELSSEDLAFRGWCESCPRSGFRQCNASRGGGRRRAHRRRRFMVAGEPAPGHERSRHAERLVTRSQSRNRGGD